MLKRKFAAWAVLIALLIAFLLMIPEYGEICSKPDNSGEKECAVQHFTTVLLWHLGEGLNYYGVAITALATLLIGYFTATIWLTNRSQVDHVRASERAYISGGGPIRQGDHGQRVFVVSVNNYGKTPGILTEYAVGFCPRNRIPVIPSYQKRVYYHDRIRPVPDQNRAIDWVDLPVDIPDPLIFGRFWYEDIWGKSHSSGFVLVIDKRGSVPNNIPRDLPSAYTAWD